MNGLGAAMSLAFPHDWSREISVDLAAVVSMAFFFAGVDGTVEGCLTFAEVALTEVTLFLCWARICFNVSSLLE